MIEEEAQHSHHILEGKFQWQFSLEDMAHMNNELEEELEERRYPILVTVYLPACIPFWSCRWLAGIISVSIRPPLFA